MRRLILLLALMLSACATTTNSNYVQTVTSWRWGHADKLLQVWGSPDKQYPLGNGDKVYIYEKESYKTYPAQGNTSFSAAPIASQGKFFAVLPVTPPPQAQGSGTYLLKCITSFEVDPRRIIVAVRAQGNNCTADQGFVASKSNPDRQHMLPPPKKS